MLNRNNFLGWDGALDGRPFYNIAANKTVGLQTGLKYIDVDVLDGSSATFGIDRDSIFASQTMPGIQPRWSAKLQRLRIFRPDGAPSNLLVSWGFKDYQGNASNLGVINLDLTVLALGWRVHPPSAYCLKDAYNTNTGYKAYSLLQQYYTASGQTYSPLVTKANAQGDPNYVAPVTDVSTCPLPSIAPFLARNATASNSQLYISRISFQVGSTPNSTVDFEFFNLAIYGGTSQTFNVPTGIYNKITIYHQQNATPTGRFFDYSPGNGSAVTQAVSTVNGGTNAFPNAPHVQPGSTLLLY